MEWNGGRQPVLLATESDGKGECENSTNMYMNLFQQTTAGGSFGREQSEDERLKNCWSQVRVMEEEIRQPAPHPIPYFIIKNGLLYCVAQRRGEEKRLLVEPGTKTETVIELAHSHPMGKSSGRGLHHTADSRLISLAGTGSRGETVLPERYNLPAHLPSSSSPQPTGATVHH